MKPRYAIFLLSCLLLMMVFPVGAQEGLLVEPPFDVSVNVRSGPGEEFSILGNLPPGGYLTVTGRNDSLFVLPCWIQTDQLWYRVDLNGMEGWVKACAVSFNGEAEALPVTEASNPVIFTFEDTSTGIDSPSVNTPPDEDFVYGYPRAVVNLRKGPGLDNDILTVVSINTPYVYVLARTADSRWVKVSYHGEIGWIARYLLLIQPADWDATIPVE